MRPFSTLITNGLRLLPMPKLSPSMKSGTIVKWLIKPGANTVPYQLVAEITTGSLLKVNDGKQEVMEIEIIEEAFLAKILVHPGETVLAGSPIAVFCDDESQLKAASDIQISRDSDVYDSPQGIPMALWQAYNKKPSIQCS